MNSQVPASDNLTVIPVERAIDDVRACVKANLSVAALVLALTIPDVLGQKCYPDLTYDDGSRKVHAQYARWFDSWVAEEFVDRLNWLDGDVCYDLRCGILHSGQADVDYRHHEQRGLEYIYDFALVDDGEQFHEERPHPSLPNTRICTVRVNADELATAICDGAERCIKRR